MPRQLPGAFCLGLLAALLAHAVVYGSGHVMGGGYAETLGSLANVLILTACVAWVATSWSLRGRLCDGTVAAARMARLLPSPGAVAAAAAAWFTLAERIEGSHPDAPVLVLAVALVLASLLVGTIARVGLLALTHVVVRAPGRPFAARLPAWAPRDLSWPVFRRASLERHLFARPPPSELRA